MEQNIKQNAQPATNIFIYADFKKSRRGSLNGEHLMYFTHLEWYAYFTPFLQMHNWLEFSFKCDL